MLKKLLLSPFVAILLTACSASAFILKSDSSIKMVSIGMAKDDAVYIMGNNYILMGLAQTAEGLEEVIGYPRTSESMYMLYFVDKKLIRWTLDWRYNTSTYSLPSTSTDSSQEHLRIHNEHMKIHNDAHNKAVNQQ